VKTPRTFYFSLDDVEKWTVTINADTCTVKEGKTDDADCFFKSKAQVFLDVWSGKKTPSATDFITGAIKSNNPHDAQRVHGRVQAQQGLIVARGGCFAGSPPFGRLAMTS
jgi:hypothetical protein